MIKAYQPRFYFTPVIMGLTLRQTVSRYISVNFTSLCFSAASLHFRKKSPSDIRLGKYKIIQQQLENTRKIDS